MHPHCEGDTFQTPDALRRGTGALMSFRPFWNWTVRGLRLRLRPLGDARHPGNDVGVAGIERLADLAAEIEPGMEQYVRQGEALDAEILSTVAHRAVAPLQAA